MGKFAILFLLAGLAVGLWLGFNPTTHSQLARDWKQVTVSNTRSRTTSSPSLSLRQLDTKVSIWLKSAQRSQTQTQTTSRTSPSTSTSTSTIGKQITAALQAFWQALQRLWLSFVAKLHAAKL